MNLANISFVNKLLDEVKVSCRYSQCYNCQYDDRVIGNRSVEILVNSDWNYECQASGIGNNTSLCSNKLVNLVEGEKYTYTINGYQENCNWTRSGNADLSDYLLPLYVLAVSLFLCAVGYFLLLMLYRHRKLQKWCAKIFPYQIDSLEDLGRPNTVTSLDSEEDSRSKRRSNRKRRVKSVDTFRGLSIVLMIFVNYGGGGYWFFNHSEWDGLTVADLVFPWFAFIMGTTVAISQFKFMRRTAKKLPRILNWLKATRRSAILFIIGICMESIKGSRNISSLRIMGPLQRLAIAYFCLLTVLSVVSIVQQYWKTRWRATSMTLLTESVKDVDLNIDKQLVCRFCEYLSDLRRYGIYLVLVILLCIGHICVSYLLPVPNCPTGYLGPGGKADDGQYENCTGGAAGFIDKLILTNDHMYQRPTCKKLYKNLLPFDPEGILGNLTSFALVLIGFMVGHIVIVNRKWEHVVIKMIIYSIICTATGVGLCESSLKTGFIPINKNLWSVSFVLITAATASILLTFLFLIIDVFQMWGGEPFRYPGMNSIVMYVGHILIQDCFPVQWKVEERHSTVLTMHIWGAVFWTLMGYLMYLKRIFISI